MTTALRISRNAALLLDMALEENEEGLGPNGLDKPDMLKSVQHTRRQLKDLFDTDGNKFFFDVDDTVLRCIREHVILGNLPNGPFAKFVK